MRHSPVLILMAFPALFGILMLALSSLWAGESESERFEKHELGAPFFGEAKDVSSFKPIPGVVVRGKVTTGRGSPILVNTNGEGKFKLPGFGKSVDADNVEISCAKQGYRTIDVIRRRVARDFDAPVEIECLLEPQN